MSNSSMKKTRVLAGCGMLAAVAAILQFLEFPIPALIPDFIKFDFSDLPELIGAYAYGPLAGIAIALVKNILHLPFTHTSGVGELANFLLGAVFAGVAGLIYKHKKTIHGALIGGIAGTVAMALASFPLNLYIVYPFYYNFFPKEAVIAAYQALIPSVNSIEKSLLVFNVPFTFVKGLVCMIISMFIYKPLSPVLHGKETR